MVIKILNLSCHTLKKGFDHAKLDRRQPFAQLTLSWHFKKFSRATITKIVLFRCLPSSGANEKLVRITVIVCSVFDHNYCNYYIMTIDIQYACTASCAYINLLLILAGGTRSIRWSRCWLLNVKINQYYTTILTNV